MFRIFRYIIYTLSGILLSEPIHKSTDLLPQITVTTIETLWRDFFKALGLVFAFHPSIGNVMKSSTIRAVLLILALGILNPARPQTASSFCSAPSFQMR